MEEVEVVVAHSERATLRVGGVFLKHRRRGGGDGAGPDS
jgi:hypothetical protein